MAASKKKDARRAPDMPDVPELDVPENERPELAPTLTPEQHRAKYITWLLETERTLPPARTYEELRSIGCDEAHARELVDSHALLVAEHERQTAERAAVKQSTENADRIVEAIRNAASIDELEAIGSPAELEALSPADRARVADLAFERAHALRLPPPLDLDDVSPVIETPIEPETTEPKPS